MDMNRIKYILDKCKNKNVLHLGCLNHLDGAQSENLHGELAAICRNLVGVDILFSPNMVQANVETMNDNLGKFDVIVCGELIEHLFNPGLFLDNIKKYMANFMIITTPNCFSIRKSFPAIFQIEKVRNDHTCWYSIKTLSNLLKMKGFEITEISYYNYLKKGKLIYKLFPYLSDGLIFVCKISNN